MSAPLRPEVVSFSSFARAGASPLHDLARAFRAGDPEALASVLALAGPALDRWFDATPAPGASASGSVPVVVAIPLPGHLAGSLNEPCLALLHALAATRPRLVPVPGLLARIADAPEAKLAPPPPLARLPSEEAETLAWRPDLLPADLASAPILLLDDIVRSGASLLAAIAAAPPSLAPRITPAAIFRAQD